MWIPVHNVDGYYEGAIGKLVEDAFLSHNRVNDVLEEVPHRLAHSFLTVEELSEASETFIRRSGVYVVQSLIDRLLQSLLKCRVKFDVVSPGNRLKDPSDS